MSVKEIHFCREGRRDCEKSKYEHSSYWRILPGMACTRAMHMFMDGRADICSCNICTFTIHGGRIRTTHMYRTYGIRAIQEQLPGSSCRGAKPAMRVMVVNKCVRFTSLPVNGKAMFDYIFNNLFYSESSRHSEPADD